jgi:DNA-binding LytR/AlgR family response regulator
MNEFEIQIGGYTKVNPQEVLMLQADVNYTTVYFIDGNKSIVATTLKKLESRFKPFNFFRPHKSFMVNLDCVKCFFQATNLLQMVDNQIVTVSRRKMRSLKKCLIVA